MLNKRNILLVVALATVLVTYFSVEVMANRGDGALGVVYVTSQGLYYDTFVSAEYLPPHGRFQKLLPVGHPDNMNGVYSETEFGPGTPGHLGGRWWIDTDEDDIMEPTDTFLLCPLLGPGREEP